MTAIPSAPPASPGRRITVHGGTGALAQTTVLAAAARAARPVHYRGVQRLTWLIAPRFAADNHAVVRIGDRARMRLDLADGYWTKLLDPRYRYEPEIGRALDRLLAADTLFLDCGANIGYWSLLAADRAGRVVAVEANLTTWRRLQVNLDLNKSGVIGLHAALWRVSGQLLSVRAEEPRQHANVSIVDPSAGTEPEATTAGSDREVTSVTIDELVDRFAPSADTPVVVKLDVEGAEVPAVDGAARALAARELVLLYEDHGNDPECTVTKYILDLGLQVLAPEDGRVLTVQQVAEKKTDPRKGYNFAACRPKSALAARLATP